MAKIRISLFFLTLIFFFSLTTSPRAVSNKDQLRAVYNPQENRFFLIWTDGRNSAGGVGCYETPGCNQDLYGAFLSSSLQLGPEFPVANEPNEQEFPDLAYNSQKNQYLLVYQRRDDDFNIYGLILNQNGQVLKSIAICTETSKQWEPTAAYDRINDRYLVTWMGLTGEFGKDVKIQLLDSNGNKIGSARTVSLDDNSNLAAGKQERPVVIFSPEEQKYLIIWEDEGRSGGSGTVLDKDGNIIINPKNFFFTQGSGRVIYPQLGYSPYLRQAMAVWQEGISSGPKKVISQRLDLSGQKIGSPIVLDQETTEHNPRPGISCDPANGSCLIGWFNWTAYAGKLQFIDKDGQKVGNPQPGVGSSRPSLAFNFQERYFLVVRSDNPAGFLKIPALAALPSPSVSPPISPSPSPTSGPTPTPTPTGEPGFFLDFKANFGEFSQEKNFLIKIFVSGTNFSNQILTKSNFIYRNLSIEGLNPGQNYQFSLFSFPFLAAQKELTTQPGKNPNNADYLDFSQLKIGDLNLDNQVNGLDWSLMKLNYGDTGEE